MIQLSNLEKPFLTFHYPEEEENKANEEIKSLENSSNQNISILVIPTCNICLEPVIIQKITTVCSHVFHEICMEEWIRINNSCPKCRTGNPMGAQVIPAPANAVQARRVIVRAQSRRSSEEGASRCCKVAAVIFVIAMGGFMFYTWIRGSSESIYKDFVNLR